MRLLARSSAKASHVWRQDGHNHRQACFGLQALPGCIQARNDYYTTPFETPMTKAVQDADWRVVANDVNTCASNAGFDVTVMGPVSMAEGNITMWRRDGTFVFVPAKNFTGERERGQALFV